MRMMGTPTTWIAFLLVTLAAVPAARACSCQSSGPPCQNYFQVDAVFAGTVQSIVPMPDDNPPFRKVRVEFTAVTPFRGTQGATATVLTADSGAACGYDFTKGEQYLVFARRETPGAALETSICSRTRALSQAADDLHFINTLAASGDGARVYGSVLHSERN